MRHTTSADSKMHFEMMSLQTTVSHDEQRETPGHKKYDGLVSANWVFQVRLDIISTLILTSCFQ